MTREELVNFLLTFDKQHVNDLVDIITDFGKGRSALNSTVKNVLIFAKESNHPFTKKDIDILLIEFQKYGGNTIFNIFRNKDNLVSYHQILDDIFKLLIGDSSYSTDEEKEQKIIQTLFSDGWQSMPFENRYKKSINRQQIILKNLSGRVTKNKWINFALKSNPLGMTASAAWDASAPALRITIPFVVQIAWLKMMEQNKLDKDKIESAKISSCHDLITTDTDGKDVILSLTEYSEPPKIKNEFNSSNIYVFNQLFSNIPLLVTKLETLRKNIVSINIDPSKLTPSKDGNGLQGMVHNINQDGHFGIKENVRIFEADSLNQAINSGIIINLASTVVAQKHLADINEKLKEIQNSIDNIKDFLSSDRRSRIDATIQLVNSVSHHMSEHNQDTSILDEVKDRLKQRLDDNLSIKLHLESDLNKTYQQIEAIKFDSFIGLKNDNDIESLIKKMQNWQKEYEAYQLCCNAVILIYTILYMGNSNKEIKEFYAKGLRDFVSDTNKFIRGKVAQMQKYLQQAHKNAIGITNFESSDLAYEALFNRCAEDFKLHQQGLSQQLEKIATSVTTPIPFKATLLIENGQIQGGQFVLD